MRRIAILLALAVVPLPVAADHGSVHIAEILPDPGDGREFIELWNDGPSIDLAGWTITDAAGQTFTFSATTLPTGGRIVVWGGGEADARGPAWRATVWNNGGDQAVLRDASGQTVDVFAYGDAAWPDGRSDPVPAAPGTGRSLSLIDRGWLDTSPSPGQAPSTADGGASATVQDVPPDAVLSAPASAQAGAVIDVTVTVSDANGDAVTWTLTADGTPAADGTESGTVTLATPTDRDVWHLSLAASDGASTSWANASITLQSAGLVILMPPGGLAFPAFPPGAAEVVTDAAFTLRNDAAEPVTPRIDISDLTGPGTIPVAGRLDIGGATWTTYDGPLTPLPSLAPGESVDLRLRLRDLPTPLPAGAYGTSFTVVA